MKKEAEILERVTIGSPLGLRFCDVVAQDPIDDGLSVVAYPSDNPLRRIQAFTNRKGVFVFRNLPGIREIRGETPPEKNEVASTAYEELLRENPKPRAFVVEVVDQRRRYQPFQLTIDVPYEGMYQWNPETVESPPSGRSWLPLYSTSSRHVPAGMAVVRSLLWDPASQVAAAWALIEVMADGEVIGRGMSGADGQVSVIFPYPEPNTPMPDGSPDSAGYTPILAQTWDLSLQAYYLPETPVSEVPDLAKVFRQTPAQLWSDFSTLTELGTQKLEFGTELIVHSTSQSNLLITPMSSPS